MRRGFPELSPRLAQHRASDETAFFCSSPLVPSESEGDDLKNDGVLWKPLGGQTAPDRLVRRGGVQGAAAGALLQVVQNDLGQGAETRLDQFGGASLFGGGEQGGVDAFRLVRDQPGQTTRAGRVGPVQQ